ncbi:acyl-CoA dehydrogenase family protein [Krasilnikovia sp. MM14-A1259]|uniref:acyl-CoA dehydrogenase family protein n=1 Tax=Krasilnikovia sp. MM14-A1259 TaxID=3373539 RepID=UPI0037FBE362
MRLAPSPEQERFAAVLHKLLCGVDVGSLADRWALGDLAPGRAVWSRLAEAGVCGLAVPARWGGLDGAPSDLVLAAEELGHHALPGPVAESMAAVPTLLTAVGDDRLRRTWLPELAAGRAVATLAAPPWLPYATDAHAADLVLFAERDAVRLARVGPARTSMDPARRLFEVFPGETLAAGPESAAAVARALNMGVLFCAAQLLGAGRALLEAAATYAQTRHQFGRAIGQFQAVQHRLADVAVALEFARPLLYAAAVALAGDEPHNPHDPDAGVSAGDDPQDAARDVSAAKVACADAADRAARAALQVHGAIGYTREYGLGRWLTKVRVLTLAWGTPAEHRARVAAALRTTPVLRRPQ